VRFLFKSAAIFFNVDKQRTINTVNGTNEFNFVLQQQQQQQQGRQDGLVEPLSTIRTNRLVHSELRSEQTTTARRVCVSV
jgi:hypothetical protein